VRTDNAGVGIPMLPRLSRKASSMKKTSGFSLIELLVVIGIILTIAAIAVPRFLRTKLSANEVSAANSLRVMASANANYHSRFNRGYAGTLAQLGPSNGSCPSVGSDCADLLDTLLSGISPAAATPIKSGYRFTYYAPSAMPSPASPNNTYAVVSTPVIPNNTGVRTFCVDQHSVVLRDTSGALTTATAAGCNWAIGGTVAPIE